MLSNLMNFFRFSFSKSNQRLFQKIRTTSNVDKQQFKYQRQRKQHYEIDGKKRQGFQRPYKQYKGQKYAQGQYKFKEHGQRSQRFPQSSRSFKGKNFNSKQQIFENSTKLRQQNLQLDADYQKMQIDWHAISQPCDEQIKQIIMLQGQKGYHKNQEMKLKITKAFRTIFQASKNRNLSPYDCLVLLVFLKYSKIEQLKFFHRSVVSVFILRYTTSNKQKFIELMKQLNNKNLQREGGSSGSSSIKSARSPPKIGQFLICQLVYSIENSLVLTYNKSKRFRLKSNLYQILNDLCELEMSMQVIKNITFILSKKIFDRSYIHDKFKVTYFVSKLQQKLVNIIKEDKHLFQNAGPSQLSLIVSVLMCVEFSVHYSKQNEKFLVDLISSDNFLPPNLPQTFKLKNYFTFYRFFSVYLDDNNKNPILEKIKQFYLNSRNSQIKAHIRQTYIIVTFISMIKAKFYNHYIRIPTKIVNQFIVIDQPIKIPQLDEFEIRFLQENKQLIMGCELAIRQILHKIYPHLIKQSQISKFIQQQKQPKYQVQTENQMTYRIKQAIKLLNIPYKQEGKIGGKKYDFLLELSGSKVILQCDGDTHIDFRRMNVSIDTAWRNMVFMLFGYQIIVINYFQFNQCRLINQIAEILSNKIKILQQHQAYLVS